MKKVDFEAHFWTKDYVKTLATVKNYPKFEVQVETGIHRLWWTSHVVMPHPDSLLNKKLDLGEGRLKDMEASGVSVHVLSLSAPGCEQFEASIGTIIAKKANDEVSRIVEKHPDKYVGFAALAPQSPGEAADELERAVKELGLKGWKTHSNICGTYLDYERYWIILDKAERLNVPIYIHPTVPAIEALQTYGFSLAGPTLGFHFETALCAMRLILSGALDKYPNLKLILGHLGESIPFFLNRIDLGYAVASSNVNVKLAKKPSDYVKNNMFVASSGTFQQPVLMCTYQVIGPYKMLFATDYPYEDSEEAVNRIEALPIPEEHKEQIYHLNAENLLQLE
ncbi:MAG: amidohydrolase family protein [Candidatus Bathyarchaeia archaeon]